jgi:hypothetical protein
LNFPLEISKKTDPERWNSGDLGWRQFLHFFSDNNSAVRRDAWKIVRYPHIAYGEDQVWAANLIEADWSKLYSPTATVYHSHDYSPSETYKRAKIESVFFYEFFGYRLGSLDYIEMKDAVQREQHSFRRWALLEGLNLPSIEEEESRIARKNQGWSDGLKAALSGLTLDEVVSM